MKLRSMIFTVALHAFAVGAVWAQGSSIKIVVPYPAAGGTDTLVRAIAAELTASLGEPVIIENKPGASGTIGAEFVANAAPDGRTLLFTSLIPTHLWYGKPAAVQNLLPVIYVARAPFLIVVNPKYQSKTLKQLVATSKANPGVVNLGSPGSASPPHIAGELFRDVAKTEFTAVPYKGAGPVIQDLVAGHVDVAFMTAGSVQALVNAGKLRALAITSRERFAALPDVPTVSESGYRDFEVHNSYGVFAPLATPASMIGKVNAAFNKAIQAPEIVKRLAEQGFEAVGGTSDDADKAMRRDMARIEGLLKAGTISFE